jgi:hypothetical protein
MNRISVKIVTQFSVALNNVPGSMATVSEALFKARVNIEGVCHTVEHSGKTARWYFVVNNLADTRRALKSIGKKASESKILALSYSDEPGVIARVARAFGNTKINIDTMYLSTPGKSKDTVLYIGVRASVLAKAAKIVKSISR